MGWLCWWEVYQAHAPLFGGLSGSWLSLRASFSPGPGNLGSQLVEYKEEMYITSDCGHTWRQVRWQRGAWHPARARSAETSGRCVTPAPHSHSESHFFVFPA